jgi:FtsP/CotA-like multicopper oxidase with cupredoxin domain
MPSRRDFLKLGAIAGAAVALPLKFTGAGAVAAPGSLQTPLPGSAIRQFVDPLPLLSVAGGSIETILAGTEEIAVMIREFKAGVLSSGFTPANGMPYAGTWVWGYRAGIKPTNPAATYIGPVIVASRHAPTQVRFVNDLGDTADARVLAEVNSTDQTIHWADPLNAEMNMCAHNLSPTPSTLCAAHYSGPIPAVPHLHGGEVPPIIDGGPDAWFTSDGAYHGHAFYTKDGSSSNYAILRYPNSQEGAPLWFHDHVLGITRLNVYAGLAGVYRLIDPDLDLPSGLHPLGLEQGAGGPVDYTIPVVLQDRMFDTNGQLYFPAGVPFIPNPQHPYWVPEFVGDTIVVNGKAWPYLELAPKRYRFLFLNGSNARTYELFLAGGEGEPMRPPMWQIETDGGYLDVPVRIGPGATGLDKLILMPGERAGVIVDFAGLQGRTLILRNTGRTPFPKGEPPHGSTVGRILQIRVNQFFLGPDMSYDPASGIPLRPPMIRLVDAAAGTLATGVTANKVRQLTLNEVEAPRSTVNGVSYPGGPLEILLNNTEWDGLREDRSARPDFTPVTVGGVTEYYSELPQEGETEVWEIVNLTADAHPIHTHLTQFQLLNRQSFNVNRYGKAYEGAFPEGSFVPTFGPPLDYNTGNPRALGGNPDITPYLQGPVMPPQANEAGWKDVTIMYPGEVTRIAVRYAPTDTPVGVSGAYSFDPDALGHGYVWHCHILDHEDNEMMRPYRVTPKAGATRSFILGTDY